MDSLLQPARSRPAAVRWTRRLLPAVFALSLTGLATALPAQAATPIKTSYTVVPPTRVANAIVNGGFETGNWSGWRALFFTSFVSPGHSGGRAAHIAVPPGGGDSEIYQQFIAPPRSTQLSFWYRISCTNHFAGGAMATLRDLTPNGRNVVILADDCTNTGGWRQATASITAGHIYILYLGTSLNETFTFTNSFDYDDVVTS
jgi:hypothetical protein